MGPAASWQSSISAFFFGLFGVRSAAVVAELQQLGYHNVCNLQHSLFEWANQGYPMENAAGPTSYVHPFNRTWGALVSPELRSYTP